MSGGQAIVKAALAVTVTAKLHVETLPAASVAVQVTVVVPTGKAEPDGGWQTTLTPGQLSVALTVKVTVADEAAGAAATVMSAGQVMTGGCWSSTVTVKVQWLALPAASVAVQVTVVVPIGNAEPEGGWQTTLTPGQLSTADTAKFTTAEHWPGSAATLV